MSSRDGVPDLFVPLHGDVDDALFEVQEAVLAQHPEATAARHEDAAFAGFFIARHDPQQGGLARSVGADEAVAGAGGEQQGHVLKENAAAIMFSKLLQCEHAAVLRRRAAP
jgi:hypothetical protein